MIGTCYDPKNIKKSKTFIQINEILQQANYDYERLQFNTIIAAVMKNFNIIVKCDRSNESDLIHYGLVNLLRILAPVCPHIAHKLWTDLNYGKNIFLMGGLKLVRKT